MTSLQRSPFCSSSRGHPATVPPSAQHGACGPLPWHTSNLTTSVYSLLRAHRPRTLHLRGLLVMRNTLSHASSSPPLLLLLLTHAVGAALASGGRAAAQMTPENPRKWPRRGLNRGYWGVFRGGEELRGALQDRFYSRILIYEHIWK